VHGAFVNGTFVLGITVKVTVKDEAGTASPNGFIKDVFSVFSSLKIKTIVLITNGPIVAVAEDFGIAPGGNQLSFL
jgi:hypothetical protein